VIGTTEKSTASTWTDDRVELLKQLWRTGGSASQIAQELGGVTRNSVIGKAHRLGLEGRKQNPSRNPLLILAKKARIMVTKPDNPAPLPSTTLTQPSGELVPFMKANSTTCRSVEGYGEDSQGRALAMFCPGPKGSEASFCDYHQALYYQKASR